ncbi:MAG: ABC transporter ATP-binding protein [Anaerolineae bacterium]|jgi:cobalt transport protein ATP-binding subunit|nr:ABC transporter ATP-binding protein [Anaerolineae bacterium]
MTLVEIDHLSYSYPDGQQALCDVSLTVDSAEKIALVGSNGAGKSTLLLHLNGVFAASQGTIKINGFILNKKNLGHIRALVGLVFQNPDDQLFSPHVFDDVAYGPHYQGLPHEEVEIRVREALAAVGMSGYEQRTSYHLSGGEKKRIAIATVLSMQPDFLVFDEPTAGLDPRARRELIELLQDLPQAMLIATHDLDMVEKLCTRTVILNQGRIRADGPTEHLMRDESLLYENGLM